MTATAVRIAAAMSGPPWTTALCRLRPAGHPDRARRLRSSRQSHRLPRRPNRAGHRRSALARAFWTRCIWTTVVAKQDGVIDKIYVAAGDRVNTGDLLLLFLLFFLFKQKADEELLIAIGLLLIL